jgi:hypothetical protein
MLKIDFIHHPSPSGYQYDYYDTIEYYSGRRATKGMTDDQALGKPFLLLVAKPYMDWHEFSIELQAHLAALYSGWRSRGRSLTSSRLRLRCGHPQSYAALRSAARHAAQPHAVLQNAVATCLRSAGPGPVRPPPPCSDHLPRRSARSGLSGLAPTPSSAASSATSVRLAHHRSMSRGHVGPSLDAPSLLAPSLAQRRESTANLRLRTCDSGH